MPRLFLVIECDPDEPQARNDQRQEATERTHYCGRPVDGAAIEPHDLQPEDNATDRSAFELPHHGSIGRKQQQRHAVLAVEERKTDADEQRIDEERADAHPEARAGQ